MLNKYLLALYFLILAIVIACSQNNCKVNGISFVASPDSLDQKHIEPIVRLNVNYAAIMPFWFIKNLQHPEIEYNSDRQWFGETKEGLMQYVAKLHQNKIKVMVKPQIWIWHGEYKEIYK